MQRGDITASDLFCGAGGASCGMWQAGVEPVAGVDQNEDALKTHAENLPGEAIQHDLADVDPSILPTTDVDWVHGSPPCQGFSQAKGSRDPDDERNELVWRFIEWVDAIRPKVVTMENVAGMQTISDHFLEEVCGYGRDGGSQQTLGGEVAHVECETDGFASIGYEARWRCLNAADYGVPQTRKRIFIVAVREDIKTPSKWFPEPTHTKDQWRTVRDAIGDLADDIRQSPGEQAVATDGGTVPNHNPEPLSEKAVEYLSRDSCHLQKHRPNQFDSPARTVPANIHRGVPYGLVEFPKTDAEEVADDPACTVSASRPYLLERGHAEHIENRSIRRLTVREAARLQSFEDDFVFLGNKTAKYRQVGNAIPPRLQFHIAEQVKEILA